MSSAAVKDYLAVPDEDFVHMGTIDEFAFKMQTIQDMQSDERRDRRPFTNDFNQHGDRFSGGAGLNSGPMVDRDELISARHNIQPQPNRFHVQSHDQPHSNGERFEEVEPKFEWGHKVHSDIQHEVTFYLTNPHKAFIEERLRQNPNDPIFSKASMRERYPPMSRNAAAEKKVDEFLTQIGATVFNRDIAKISATAPIHVWEKALKTEFFQLHTNVGERPVVHRAKAYSLPKDVAPHVAIVGGVAEYPSNEKKLMISQDNVTEESLPGVQRLMNKRFM